MLSASPDIYVGETGTRLGFNAALSTKTEFKNGRFTGRISGENLRGREKARALRLIIDNGAYDLSESRGYGNKDDTPWLNLLESVSIY